MHKSKFALALSFFFIVTFTGAGSTGKNQQERISFNGKNAYEKLVEQCKFGPRFPGLTNYYLFRQWIVEQLQPYTCDIELQEFKDIYHGKIEPMVNIIAHFNPGGERKIFIAAHYDARPIADRDSNPENRSKPIPGANDGASGTALLLELARVLNHNVSNDYSVDLIFLDGEDGGSGFNKRSYCKGSSFFAKSLQEKYYDFGIVVDMIGDKNLDIYREQNSHHYCHDLLERFWSSARTVDNSVFHSEIKYAVFDDHIPFIERGIPTILIIDFDYKYWHTLDDTPSHCSSESLQKVGDAITAFIDNM